jgi:NADPH-dependent glutamate synthase beta subunit-like oxidoreductase
MMDTKVKVGDTVSFLSLYTFVDYAERVCVAEKRKRFTGKVKKIVFFSPDGLDDTLVVVAMPDGKNKSAFVKRDDVKVVADMG